MFVTYEARLRRKFPTRFSAKRVHVALAVVGAFDIVSVETCQSSFRAGRIRRYARGHVAGNRVDAGGARATSGAPGVHHTRASGGTRKTMQTAIAIYYSSNKGRGTRAGKARRK